MGRWTLWGWVQGSVTYKPAWNSMLATQMLAGQLHLCSSQDWLGQHTTHMMLTWTALSFCTTSRLEQFCLLHRCCLNSCVFVQHKPDFDSILLRWCGQLCLCTTSRQEQYAGYADVGRTAALCLTQAWLWQHTTQMTWATLSSAQQAAWNSMLATQMIARQLHLCPSQAGLGQHTTQMTWTASSCSVTSQTGTAC